MKKTVIFLIIVFCLAVAVPFISATAQSSVYFTVVNDRLLDFNDEIMPVKIGDVYYFPISDFNQYSLSTYTTYNRDRRVATIYSDDKSLSFELASGSTYDDKGKVYPFSAIYYNSGVYVPAVRTCQFFGFKFSVYSNNIAEFLRIKNTNYTLSDDDFARLAALMMQSLLNEYAASHAQASHAQASPTPSVTPSTPTPTPSSTEEPEKFANVYLSIRGIGNSTASILNSLDYYDYNACFFVTADEILKNPDLLRRISGSGYGIGILCSQNLAEDYSKASKLLREAANVKSVIIAFDCQYTTELGSAAQKLGLIVWNDTKMPVFGHNSSATVTSIYNMLQNASGRIDLSFSADSVSLLREAISDIYSNNYTVKTINETATSYLSGF